MDTIALVWIGFGGSHADLEPSGNATGYVSGYETDAERPSLVSPVATASPTGPR